MGIKQLKTIKSDQRGIMYNCDKLNYIERKKDTISADHSHEDQEILYLVKGKIQLTIGNETRVIETPARIEIAPDTYHKIRALSDIILLEDRESE